MKMLKERRIAFIIAVIVVLASMLFGVHRSISKEVRKVEAQFYDGVYIKAEKYVQPSIDSQLSKRIDSALGLVTLAQKYEALQNEAQELRDARSGLMNASGIEDKYLANVQMQNAYDILCEGFSAVSFADNDAAAYSNYTSSFDGAGRVIMNSNYNMAVSEFERMSGKFPVSLLRGVTFARMPEYFGVEG